MASIFRSLALSLAIGSTSACAGVLGIDYLSNDEDGGTAILPAAPGASDATASDTLARAEASADAPSDRTVSSDTGDGAVLDAGTRETGADGGPMGDATDSNAVDGPSDSGPDGPGCTDACILGSGQCVSGTVQECMLQGNCTQWVTMATCGTHQTCMATADAGAACSCNASICSQAGSVCQDGQTAATCAADTDGCLYVAATTGCTAPQSCSGMAPNAACSLTCTSSCTQGQASCVSGGLATCTLGSNGCWAYGIPAACGTHQSCTGSAGAAKCTCNTDPVCGASGNVCSNSSTVVSCAQDAQGCFYPGSSMPCTNGACSGGQCCTNSCAQGQTSCVSGGLATCTQQSNGCWAFGAPAACGMHQSCPSGATQCTCNTDPVCSATGNVCPNSSTAVSCAQDAQGCFYQASSTSCTNGACSGGQCCTNACTNGSTQCLSTSSTQIQSCSAGGNGCSTWTTSSCSSAYVCERYGSASCVDPQWAEWPMPATSGTYADNGDGTVTDNTTLLVWQKSTPTSTFTQDSAITYCNTSLNLAGFGDWRLPSLIELLSIVDPTRGDGNTNPAINTTAFPGTQPSGYWTSTSAVPIAGDAWYINFADGSNGMNAIGTQEYVRCVR